MENFIMYFTAQWCSPCMQTRPIVESLNKETENPKIFIIDADEVPQMMKDFEINGVPTFIFIKNEKEVRRETGSRSEDQLREFLDYIEQ